MPSTEDCVISEIILSESAAEKYLQNTGECEKCILKNTDRGCMIACCPGNCKPLELLKSGLVDNSLLCELATHPDFPRLMADPQLRQLVTAHIDEDSFCRYVIQQDINKIALDLRETHKDDFFSVLEDNPLKGFLQAADEAASEDGDPEQVALAFICKRLKLNLKKLSEDEKK